MQKYLWTIGGGWSEQSSIEGLMDCYYRSGNMRDHFVAFGIDDQGKKVQLKPNEIRRIKQHAITIEKGLGKLTPKKKTKKWWEFWK
jgi:hypothetical protein